MRFNSIKSVLILLLLFVAVLTGFWMAAFFVAAGTSHDVKGWGWAGSGNFSGGTAGFGWVSMNSLDCDINGDGVISGAAETSLGCNAGPTADYGVIIPTNVGEFLSGYAWSEHYGWISFNEADVASCPEAPCNARRVADGIAGWARILSIRDGGSSWSGFLKLRSTTEFDTYGVDYDSNTEEFSGYAYSDEIGWLQFNAPITGPNVTLVVTNCLINSETDYCNGQAIWDLQAVPGPYEVRNITTDDIIGTASTSPPNTPIQLTYGLNLINASADMTVLKTVNANAQCGNGLFWHPAHSTCKFDPEIFDLPAPNALLIRSGKQAPISFKVRATYDVDCSILGGSVTPNPFAHRPLPNTSSYDGLTDELRATQLVKISCSPTGLTAPIVEETIRVNVVSVFQET